MILFGNVKVGVSLRYFSNHPHVLDTRVMRAMPFFLIPFKSALTIKIKPWLPHNGIVPRAAQTLFSSCITFLIIALFFQGGVCLPHRRM